MHDTHFFADPTVLVLSSLPAAARASLSALDYNGDGTVDALELKKATNLLKASLAAADGSFAIAALPKELQPPLKAFDVDGDGTIRPMELARGAELYEASKSRVKQLTRLAVALFLLMGVMLAAITGLTFTVVELSKDTKMDGATMVVKSGTYGKNTIKTAAASTPAPLSSCLPTSYFDELQKFHVKSGLAEVSLQVLGFVRMPRGDSLYGTVVMLVTHLGRVVIDGETLSYIDDIGNVFADAGFAVDGENRRLLDVLELVGLYNNVPEEAWDCYDPATDGPTPVFPDTFVATGHKLEPCVGSDLVDHCAAATEAWQTAALTVVDGERYAQAHGRVIVGAAQGFLREEWTLPSRAPDFTRVTMRDNAHKWTWMSSNDPAAALAASDEFADHVTALSAGNTPDHGVARDAGFYCKRTAFQASATSLKDLLNEPYNAAYMGAVTIGGVSARHWILNPKGEDHNDIVMHLYDSRARAAGTTYDYLPLRYELYSIARNMLIERQDFDTFAVGAAATAVMDVTKPAASHLPGLCYWYGTNGVGPTDAQGTGVVRGMPDGDGVVPIEQFLLSASPLPMADGPVSSLQLMSEDVGAFAASRGEDTSDERALEAADGRRRGVLSAGEGHRKLQGYSCCMFDNGEAQSLDIDPVLEFEMMVSGVIAEISVSATLGFGKPLDTSGTALICAIEVSAGASLGVGFSLPLVGGAKIAIGVSGSVYGDWDNANPSGCIEVGGCVTAELTLEFRFLGRDFELDILSFTGCVLAGVGSDPNGVTRTYIALQLAATATIRVPGVLTFENTGSLFLKYFYPHPDVLDGRTMHFHPYLQHDMSLNIFNTGHEFPSNAFNLLAIGGGSPMKRLYTS